jgi:hypothetical protein
MSESSITYEYITELLTSQDFKKLNELIATDPTIFDTVRRADGLTLLFWANVENKPLDTFLFLLKNMSLDTVNERFLGGRTILADKCSKFDETNRSEIVRALLDKGADRTIRDIWSNNMTPFEVAALNNLDEICLIFEPSGLKPRRIKHDNELTEEDKLKQKKIDEYLHYERQCPNPIPFYLWNKK